MFRAFMDLFWSLESYKYKNSKEKISENFLGISEYFATHPRRKRTFDSQKPSNGV